jgi:hypothetical protein
VPNSSKPKTFEDYLREIAERIKSPYKMIAIYGRGDQLVLSLPNPDGEDDFSVDGNTVTPLATPLTEPKGG